MKEVYVLFNTGQYDSGIFINECSVYNTYENAVKALKKLKIKITKDWEGSWSKDQISQDKFNEGDMSWSIWETEEYSYNHHDLIIFKSEVI